MKTYSRRQFSRSLGLAAGGVVAQTSFAASSVSPTQTEGPFYPVHTQADKDADLTRIDGHEQTATGEQILVRGSVFDTAGNSLVGATVDVWQANHFGRYDHPKDPNPAPLDPHFQSWAILETDASGHFGYKTIMPAPYPLGAGDNAPVRCRHIHYKVSHADHELLTTQMYFSGDPLIESDSVINRLPKEQRQLLIADQHVDEETGLPLYLFNIVLA